MVSNHSQSGLIIAANAQMPSAIDELAARIEWPVFASIGRREIVEWIEAQRPEFAIIWLDHRRDVESIRNLLAWLRGRGPKPRRIVVGYHLDEGVEVMIRAAGAHSYLPANCSVAALAEELMAAHGARRGQDAAAPSRKAGRRHPAAARGRKGDLEHNRPP